MTTRPAPLPWLAIVLCAAGLFAASMGVRQSLPLFLGTLNTQTGLGIAAISLAFAIGQLMWGVTQPIAGACADRFGPGRVMLVGGLAIALGTALIPYAGTLPMLILTIGVLGAGGAGALGPSVLMGAVARRIDPARRGMATGIVGAGGSFGQFAVIPLAQWMIGGLGWVQALWGLSLLTLLALPMILALRVPPGEAGATAAGGATLGEAVRGALRDPSFLLLSAGFFVCGFHVAFIATHLPGVVAACGLPPSVGAWALAVVGLFNIAGSFAIGWAVDRWRMKSLLSLIYTTRAVAVLAFVLAPKTEAVVLVFAAVIGFTYLSTVPPTAGLVAKLHGARYMATLFGLVMLSHQVGGFLGAGLGGKAFEATGSYDWMWWIDIALAVGAALLHLPIREARVAPRAAAAAA
ncbi:MAG: MFS transporter [Burkholderiales bacterium]